MEYILKNIMEELVIKKYNEMYDSLEGCKCEKCRFDTISYALNKLPPKYIVSNQGELYAMVSSLDVQFKTNIVTTLIKASQVINKNPTH